MDHQRPGSIPHEVQQVTAGRARPCQAFSPSLWWIGTATSRRRGDFEVISERVACLGACPHGLLLGHWAQFHSLRPGLGYGEIQVGQPGSRVIAWDAAASRRTARRAWRTAISSATATCQDRQVADGVCPPLCRRDCSPAFCKIPCRYQVRPNHYRTRRGAFTPAEPAHASRRERQQMD